MATELKAKMGEDEKQIPAWIQDHIAKAENLISQASTNYHEYGDSNENINEAPKKLKHTISKKEWSKIPKYNKHIGMDGVHYIMKYDDKIGTYLQGVEIVDESIKEDRGPCWKGYKQVGMKDKGGRQVPNCVPNESVVNEAPNTGERIQNLNNRIKALRDKLSATKSPEQKKLFQDRLKNALQTLSNIKKDYGIKKEISSRTPKIFVKTAAVEKKIKELMADRKKAVVPYNSETDPAKKEKLKQILIKLTNQIKGYEKNLVQLRDMEEEYLQQMHADAELDTTGL
jgi:flagellar biosynthesis chaperone FliJ